MYANEKASIISRPINNYLELSFFLILSFTAFILFFSFSIIEASWIVTLFSLYFFLTLLPLINGFLKKKYSFYPDMIIVENFRNKYLREVDVKNIVSWNEYKIERRKEFHYYLIIKTLDSRLVIEKNKYKNFEHFVEYFRQTGIPVDKSLKVYVIFSERYATILNSKLYLTFLSSSFLILSLFWSIVSTKSDSDETIKLQGKIINIRFNKRDVDLVVEGYPNLRFVTNDRYDEHFFAATHYINGEEVLLNKGKRIELQVLKSDYDWRMNNKFVRALDFLPDHGLTIIDYTILNP